MRFQWLQRLLARTSRDGAEAAAATLVMDEPAADEPAVVESAADERVAAEPAAAEPAADELAMVEPAVDELAVVESAADEPPADEPAADGPAADEPRATPASCVATDDEPPPPADPRYPESSVVVANVASSASLGRSLAERVRVLMDGASPEARKSDGPALVEALLECHPKMIRQPTAAARQALVVSRDPRASTRQIAALFEDDPGLAQSLLTLANSAYYARGDSPLASIHDAVRRVGRRAVESVLMESMVQALLCRSGGAFEFMMRMTWTHMQRTAPIARAIAREFGVHPDTAYSLALLHDVGKLVIFDLVSTLRAEEQRDLSIPEEFFRALVGQLHEPIGGMAMLRWGMGGDAAFAIGEHHRHALPEQPSPETEVLFVAEAIELSKSRGDALDWDELWQRGGIRADAAIVAELLREMDPAA